VFHLSPPGIAKQQLSEAKELKRRERHKTQYTVKGMG